MRSRLPGRAPGSLLFEDDRWADESSQRCRHARAGASCSAEFTAVCSSAHSWPRPVLWRHVSYDADQHFLRQVAGRVCVFVLDSEVPQLRPTCAVAHRAPGARPDGTCAPRSRADFVALVSQVTRAVSCRRRGRRREGHRQSRHNQGQRCGGSCTTQRSASVLRAILVMHGTSPLVMHGASPVGSSWRGFLAEFAPVMRALGGVGWIGTEICERLPEHVASAIRGPCIPARTLAPR